MNTERVTMEKCCCGHASCRDWWISAGKFCQGSGFDEVTAKRIVDFLNGDALPPATADAPAKVEVLPWPRVRGCGRSAEEQRALVLHLASVPSDDDIRNIHDALNGRYPLPPHPQTQPSAATAVNTAEGAIAWVNLNWDGGGDPYSPIETDLHTEPLGYIRIGLDNHPMRQKFCDAIMGALMYGYQGVNKAPPGHWLEQFWTLGNTQREQLSASPPASASMSAVVTDAMAKAMFAEYQRLEPDDPIEPNEETYSFLTKLYEAAERARANTRAGVEK